MTEAPPPGVVSGVILPPRIAYVLETKLNLGAFRSRVRGDDRDLDTVLTAIRWAAMNYATAANGSAQRKPAEAARALNHYTPAEVAARTGVTAHAVRLAIREGRLKATKNGRSWLITPADYFQYRRQHRQ